jgi:hypothetical protein
VVELLLFQADGHKPLENTVLRKGGIDKLVAAKEFIDTNYLGKIRIGDLVKIAGTNQHTVAFSPTCS